MSDHEKYPHWDHELVDFLNSRGVAGMGVPVACNCGFLHVPLQNAEGQILATLSMYPEHAMQLGAAILFAAQQMLPGTSVTVDLTDIMSEAKGHTKQ